VDPPAAALEPGKRYKIIEPNGFYLTHKYGINQVPLSSG